MEEHVLENTKKAIALAERCKPIADRIPKVGAILIDETVIGQGSRGNGNPGGMSIAVRN